MSLDILGIAESALSAFQMGVAVSSKNIADSADPDYSREMTVCSTMLGGTLNVNVKRISDDFLSSQLNEAHSSMGQFQASSPVLSGIDQFITGLNGTDSDGSYNLLSRNLQGFLDSLSMLSSNVNSSTKQGVISQAKLLSSTLGSAADYINSQKNNLDSKIKDAVNQVNTLSQQIAKINDKIQKTSGQPSPDLLDRREKLISELSKYVRVSVSNTNGVVNVSLQSGSSLVVGNSVSPMTYEKDDFNDQAALSVNGSLISSLGNLSGTLGGLIETRNNAIPEIQDKIGLIAAGLVTAYNDQNKQGYVSPNTKGGNIFQPLVASAHENKNNQGDAALTTEIDPQNLDKLNATSYILTETSAGQYQVTDQKTGKQTIFSSFPITIDGLKINQVSGSMQVGDSFKINPLEQAASSVKVTAGENDIALSSQSDATGTGNINALADIGNKKIFAAGQSNLTEVLSNTFSEIGSMTRSAETDYSAAKISYTQANNDKQSLSGVNTQEEYTNIVYFQQAYSAASKIISEDEKLFNSMLSVMGE